MKSITLSIQDWQTVMAAVEACAPSGGGSDTFSVVQKLVAQGLEHAPHEKVGQMQMTAAHEYNLAMNGE